MTPADFARALAPLQRRIMLAVSRGVLRAVADAEGIQQLQVTMLAGETRDAVERMQPYGLSAVPLPGAQCVVICVGGNRDHPIAIAVDDPRFRPTDLQPGEVRLYNDQAGVSITLKNDRSILVEGREIILRAEERVRVEAPLLECTGDVTADGISLIHHRHGGVQSGAAQTDEPA
ncbi:phage baseplate assembly protein V [Humitalea rosea]|uniref:Phage baseplate assembly protein V n=1 Tax=Humitalea rosea TaxID=990373 RepID=A0A2W7ILF9_9PROT|nr:phage baseplate assembly protein [Humitalea rosea]PZW46847.1 phage baseplate assembly protein V [Humitalea rosea]